MILCKDCATSDCSARNSKREMVACSSFTYKTSRKMELLAAAEKMLVSQTNQRKIGWVESLTFYKAEVNGKKIMVLPPDNHDPAFICYQDGGVDIRVRSHLGLVDAIQKYMDYVEPVSEDAIRWLEEFTHGA